MSLQVETIKKPTIINNSRLQLYLFVLKNEQANKIIGVNKDMQKTF